MIKCQQVFVETQKETSITCDVCGKEYSIDDGVDVFEAQEFLRIDFTGGYDSVFGDGTKVQAEICQHCLKKRLGKYLRLRFLYEE